MTDTGDRFRDRIVWITGASGGLGEALAHAFRAAGARIVLSARRADELRRVAADLGGESADVVVVPLDLAEERSVLAAAETVLGRLGAPDVLVNNAGLTQRALIRNTALAVYRRLFEVNVLGPLALAKAVLPAMAERGSGRIVVVSSITACFPSAYRSGYSAAKMAVGGLFEALRAEAHRDGIGVTIVLLGGVRTGISANALRGDGSVYGRMDPVIAGGMDPDEAARRILAAVAAGRERVTIAPLSQRFLVWRGRYLPGLAARAARLKPRKA